MALGVQITGLTQQKPYTNTTATITVQFAIIGDTPDFVQVYAPNLGETEPGGIGDIKGLIDFTQPNPPSFCTFTVPAGAVYNVAVCPRTGTIQDPDDDLDGVSWETFCAWETIVAQATEQVGGQQLPPWISALNPEPATLSQPDRIVVTWGSPQPYDKFLIWWTQNGDPMDQAEIDGTATTGSWTATPITPGARYTFAVKGGVSGGILGNYLYSDWSPTLTIVAPPHLRRLRQFLTASGINPAAQRVRSLLHGQTSLRKFMKLA
jgi:hypothetical protein